MAAAPAVSGCVIVTGARAPVALDCARALAATGAAVHLVDSVTPWAARCSRLAASIHRVPRPRQAFPAFRAALRELVARLDPTLIVPTCEEVFYLAAAAQADGYADRLFAPPLDLLRVLHSKVEFIRLCARAGVAAPETVRLTARDELAGLPLDRLVLKPEFSRFAVATRVRPDARALAGVVPSPEQPWAAQAFVAGEELCLWSAVVAGRVTAHATYRPLHRHGRAAAYSFAAIDCPAAVEVARRIAAATGLTGHLSFDLIRTADGAVLPIECNPRAVSGLHLFDAAPALARAFAGEDIGAPPAGRVRHLAPAMALLGVPAAVARGQLGALARDWRRGSDAIGPRGDRWPMLGAMLDAGRFATRGLLHGRSPAGETTDDIEWNGQPIR